MPVLKNDESGWAARGIPVMARIIQRKNGHDTFIERTSIPGVPRAGETLTLTRRWTVISVWAIPWQDLTVIVKPYED